MIEEIMQRLTVPPGFTAKAVDYMRGYLCVQIDGPRRIIGVAALSRSVEGAVAKIESDWEPWL